MTNDLENKLSELESICKSVKSGGPDYTGYPDEVLKLIKALRVMDKAYCQIYAIFKVHENAISLDFGNSNIEAVEHLHNKIQQIMCGGGDE